jgi:radical SAM protein with 4Fe4S-binding SPASM domain
MERPFPYLKFLKKILEVSVYKNFDIGFQMPYKYIFLLTNKCNSRCKTCKIWKIYQDRPELIKEELFFEEYEKIFENIKKEVFWLNFSGGEPFLREDLVELTKIAKEKFKNLFLFTIPTNGLNSKEIEKKVGEILEILDNIKFIITVSIDGTEKVNDFIRGINGSYKKAIKTYKALKKFEKEFENFHVGIQVTLSRYNIDKIYDFIKKFNNETVYYTFAQEASYFNNLNEEVGFKRCKKKEIIDTLKYIEKFYITENFQDFLYKLYLKLAQKYYENPEKLVLPCYATYATVIIDCYGNVWPCSYFNSVVGNLRDENYDMKKIFMSKKMENVRKKIKLEKCPKCWTNCDGLPTLIQNFPLSFMKS